jgi:hypothetical protein
MSENSENLGNPNIEAEARRDLNRGTARKVLQALGIADAADKVAANLQGKDPTSLEIEDIARKRGMSTEDFVQKAIESEIARIKSVPKFDDAKSLLITAVSGRPAIESPTEDTVVQFHLAAPSKGSKMLENPTGQSPWVALANPKDTEKLLRAVLEETGFIGKNDFASLNLRLRKSKSGYITLTHPQTGIEILIKRPAQNVPETGNPLDWAYNISITRTKT